MNLGSHEKQAVQYTKPVTNQVIVFDENNDTTQLFIDMGFTPVRYSQWGINTGQTGVITHDIVAHKYSMLWMNFPNLLSLDRKYNHMTKVVEWAKHCTSVGIPFILFGPFGRKWQDPQLHVLEQQGVLDKKHHRLCHFGLKADYGQQKPSSTCFVTLSNVPLQAHPCKCNISRQDHVFDLLPKNTTTAQSKLLAILLPRLCTQLFPNDSNDMTPSSNIHQPKHAPTGHRTPVAYPTQNVPTTLSTPTTQHLHITVTTDNPDTTQAHLTIDKQAKELRAQRKELRKKEHAFPTEERIRQKEYDKQRKEKGIEVKKRIKIIEDHVDDCGNDLGGLGDLIKTLHTDYIIEEDSDDEDDDAQQTCTNFSTWAFLGSDWAYTIEISPVHTVQYVKDTAQAIHILGKCGRGIDIVELCGGAGRVSRVGIRRRLKVGKNFDLVFHCDLNKTSEQRMVEHYYDTIKPLVSVSAPTCTPFGSWAHYNYYAHYDAWLKAYNDAAPHGKFCGRMALKQDNEGRFWLNEQPRGSWLYIE